MLALAGYPLGMEFVFWNPQADCPAGSMAPVIAGEFDEAAFASQGALNTFVSQVDRITFEFENVPLPFVERLARERQVLPSPQALRVGQDRWEEKTFFRRHRVPTPDFQRVDTWEDLERASRELGLPLMLKTRRLGYDGKGQAPLRSPSDLRPAWERLQGVPLLAEKLVRFQREVSLLSVRDAGGQMRFYPLVENHHQDGILRWSLAPAPQSTSLTRVAQSYARRMLTDLGYVGVLTVEFFVVDGKLMANEMAPRVHNSGHWTIEGAATSQFENHLRAVAGLPLGDTSMPRLAAMVNLIGSLPDLTPLLKLPDTHLHLYGKAARPGRKLGHVTVLANSPQALAKALRRTRKLVS
jgi:5-(carboxyamino)imidazole ribonucleotide synthase